MSTEPRSPAISKSRPGRLISTPSRCCSAPLRAFSDPSVLRSGNLANFNDIARAAEQSIYRNALQATGNSSGWPSASSKRSGTDQKILAFGP